MPTIKQEQTKILQKVTAIVNDTSQLTPYGTLVATDVPRFVVRGLPASDGFLWLDYAQLHDWSVLSDIFRSIAYLTRLLYIRFTYRLVPLSVRSLGSPAGSDSPRISRVVPRHVMFLRIYLVPSDIPGGEYILRFRELLTNQGDTPQQRELYDRHMTSLSDVLSFEDGVWKGKVEILPDLCRRGKLEIVGFVRDGREETSRKVEGEMEGKDGDDINERKGDIGRS